MYLPEVITFCCYYYPLPNISGTLLGCTIGGTTQLKHDSAGGSWESSDTTIAKVDAKGNVKSIANGIATIMYAYPKKPCGWHYTATDYTVSTVAIPLPSTGANSVCVGSSIALSNATPTPSGGRGVWSSIAGIATVNNSGVVTGNSRGTAKIRYTVVNELGCTNYTDKDIAVNAIPATPSIGYKAPFSNPQAGAPTGGFCVGKVFGVLGSPLGGVWSTTGCISVTQLGIATINTTSAGSLTYRFTDGNGCSNSRTMTGAGYTCAARMASGQSLVASGVFKNDFVLYPNPAKTSVNLKLEILKGTGSILIADVFGKQVKTQPLSMGNNTVDIANLSKGMYFISTTTSNGKTTKKLVVE